MSTEKLITALESMDVLNRWVRMSGASRPRKAVYWLKSKYAIRDAIMAGMATAMRYVQATVKCNRCVSGTYFDWDGAPRGQCYHCNGRGQAELKFVETQIAGRFTWHTPLQYSYWHGWSMSDLKPEPVTDWQPGREGIDLPIEDAARHLNVVEAHWTQWASERPWENGFDEYDSTRYFTFNYSLPLPSFGEDVCFRCNRPKEIFCSTTFPPGLETKWPTCKACSDDPKIWDVIRAMPLPKLSPEFEIWRYRHMTQFADIWKGRWGSFCEEWQLNQKRQVA